MERNIEAFYSSCLENEKGCKICFQHLADGRALNLQSLGEIVKKEKRHALNAEHGTHH